MKRSRPYAISFDPEADAAYVTVSARPKNVAETRVVGDDIMVDVASDGTVLGVEILGVERRLAPAVDRDSYLAGLADGILERLAPQAAE